MSNKRPNIIFIVLDTHRAERMSLYGYGKDTTPVMSEFADEATVFDWAVAPAPWTIPSHASMFTGVYPTIHQTIQSYTALTNGIPTIAELLQEQGYDTIGFCNNPLVGVLDNGLKRGFNEFYNYSGTVPDIPAIREDDMLKRFQQWAARAAQAVTVPIEKRFGESPLLLKLATMPWFVPIWTQLGSFKGDTHKSLVDVADYVDYHTSIKKDEPFFMFINMMETHLPYYPPRYALDKWAPYLKKDREARDFLQQFNLESYRWMAPMIEPFSEMQHGVLSDVYDAEVAYQDQQLHHLFETLERSGQMDNTMVILISDHGESHGDHEFMGHGFVIYNELVRVPMIIRYPDLFPGGARVDHNVSARRVFHTMMEAAGLEHEAYEQSVATHSLTQSLGGPEKEPENEYVIAEAYPPLNFINVMEMSHPDAIEEFRVRMMRRAIYNSHTKLMTVDGKPDEFFDVRQDYFELENLIDSPTGYENELVNLQQRLEEYIVVAEAHRDGTAAGEEIDYSDNPELLDRLRGLGYLE